ncbi:MAG TPA: hypothetical protein VMW08_00070 [Acidimicrobiales bacterium]|nr:hypothetical protein [Acidimicrobiales bacterium]
MSATNAPMLIADRHDGRATEMHSIGSKPLGAGRRKAAQQKRKGIRRAQRRREGQAWKSADRDGEL